MYHLHITTSNAVHW